MESLFDAYVTCALWSSTDESRPDGGDYLDANYTIADFDRETLETMRADCKKFEDENFELLTEENTSSRYGVMAQAGHDFWLTRNGHGCGFWDGDWSEPAATKLTEASKQFGEYYLYIGDDGKIYGQ